MASYNARNPIRTVDNAYIPVPSSYQVEYNDVSQPDAGRTEDGTMHKLRLGTARKISLEWQNILSAPAQEVLAAFTPEYVTVQFKNPLTNDYKTDVFYVGDRSAKMIGNNLPVSATGGAVYTVSLNLIERSLVELGNVGGNVQ